MSTLLYGQIRDGTPAVENVVRRNTFPVAPDSPPAEAEGAPEFNEVETDNNPNLGLVNRQVASDWHAGEKFTPSWIGDVNENDQHNNIIDKQVSTSGTAAAREAAGQFGHGTASYAVGIEPTIGATPVYGNDYFTVHDKDIQDTAGDYMAPPPGYDHDANARVAAMGAANARDASVSGQYTDWYAAMMEGRV